MNALKERTQNKKEIKLLNENAFEKQKKQKKTYRILLLMIEMISKNDIQWWKFRPSLAVCTMYTDPLEYIIIF